MKKFMKSMLVASMALSLVGCNKEDTSKSDEGVKEWKTYQTLAGEMSTWNILYTQAGVELSVLTNFIDGLLTHDTNGKLIASLAETWETNEDATVWTFHLREGVKWVDYTGKEVADLTAQDFITGLEYVLNYNKNGGANASMAIDTVAGAEDYYVGTKEGTLTEADFLSTVGIKAVDDHTIEYTMHSPKTYFDTLGTYATFYPLSQAAIDAYGDDYGTDNTTILYCGAYLCPEYVNKNSKTYVPNPTWWDKESTRFEKVTVSMVEDANKAWQLFQSGEVYNVDLTEDALTEIYNAGESNEYYKYLAETKPSSSYFMLFNMNSKTPDGSDDTNWNLCAQNENFRKIFYYGLDWTDYLKRINKINPGSTMSDMFTCEKLVFNSEGKDYQELVWDKLGYKSDTTSGNSVHARYDTDKAADYKEEAIKELTAQGVTFPVTCYYFYKAGDTVAADTAAVVKQMFEEQLGSDFINVEFRTYSESSTQEIRKPELFSISIGGWGADFGDPISYLGQLNDSNNAFYNEYYINMTKDMSDSFANFCDLVDVADKITDLDARFDAFADAEVAMLDMAMIVPVYKKISWQITKVNDYSKKSAKYGIQGGKMINWETTSNTAFTTEEYEKFAAK